MLKLGEGAHDGEHEMGHGRVFAGEGKTFLDELDAYAAPRQLLNDLSQVVEVTRQPVHAMDDDRIAIASKSQERLQLRSPHIFSRSLVRKDTVYRNVLQLALRVLVKAADTHITDPLSTQKSSPGRECRVRVLDPLPSVSENAKCDPIPTLFGPLSDVDLECTLFRHLRGMAPLCVYCIYCNKGRFYTGGGCAQIANLQK